MFKTVIWLELEQQVQKIIRDSVTVRRTVELRTSCSFLGTLIPSGIRGI